MGEYFLISGGDFEGDLSDWTLNHGAAMVPGNESYQLGSPGRQPVAGLFRTAAQ